ncbi:magnetosome biogenesis CDF transporter MamM [Magnetovibrio blakemorei]|uniref:Magnetosome protein MamM n=3 Tax=Pseudomonadota TaxID=1224 RepID=C4RAG9_9PROT|nr:magnetosome biogenesis CDF transporter MamM [Magnetovibrio blakemorei]ASN76793.1 MamM [Vibrio sp. MV-1]CAV30814.1 magnetosome protein MamM [Magnetovibrio blakemorei]
MRYEKCIKCSRSIGWIGLITNSVLMVLKAFVGLVAGSQAMVADAMYSAKDVVGSLMAIVGMTVSEQALDREHPYGHGKIEFVLSLFVSVIFFIIAAYLLVHAIFVLMDPSLHRAPHLIALWASLLVVIVNVIMYFYSRCVAIETNSPLVRTLAKHHHGDAASSGVVALGIIGAHFFNMPWIDTVVAAFETVHLMYMGGHVFWDSTKGLMDRSVGTETRSRIEQLATSVDGVKDILLLRTRHVGQNIHAELAVGVASDLMVAQAHKISEMVKEIIVHNIPRIGSIQVSTGVSGHDVHEQDSIRANWEKTQDNPETETKD